MCTILRRFFSDIKCGFYVDVGANDPHIDSVTEEFYNDGWSGINIEPVAEHIASLNAARPRDTNIHIAAGRAKDTLRFYTPAGTRGLGSCSRETAELHRKAGHTIIESIVSVAPLHTLIPKDRQIHFLKIDTEGHEYDVLQGAHLQHYRPWIIMIESVYPNSTTPCYERWENLLLHNSYIYVRTNDKHNRYYVSAEHEFDRIATLCRE